MIDKACMAAWTPKLYDCLMAARATTRRSARARSSAHQTTHALRGRIFAPALQRNAFANSGVADSVPLTRHFGGEWTSTVASSFSKSGRIFAHHAWPNARKNC